MLNHIKLNATGLSSNVKSLPSVRSSGSPSWVETYTGQSSCSQNYIHDLCTFLQWSDDCSLIRLWVPFQRFQCCGWPIFIFARFFESIKRSKVHACESNLLLSTSQEMFWHSSLSHMAGPKYPFQNIISSAIVNVSTTRGSSHLLTHRLWFYPLTLVLSMLAYLITDATSTSADRRYGSDI